MSRDLERIEKKVDKLDERLDHITIQLTRNTDSLEEHMKRSDHLEKIITPIHQDHLAVMRTLNAFKWVLGIVGAAVGIAVGISRLL